MNKDEEFFLRALTLMFAIWTLLGIALVAKTLELV